MLKFHATILTSELISTPHNIISYNFNTNSVLYDAYNALANKHLTILYTYTIINIITYHENIVNGYLVFKTMKPQRAILIRAYVL